MDMSTGRSAPTAPETGIQVMVLEGSAQEADIKGGKAPSEIWGDPPIGRVKQYIKADEMSPEAHPARVEFPQPYQVAAERLGCSWNATNPVWGVQFAGCNLDCPWCFVGKAGETTTVTPPDIVAAYYSYFWAMEHHRKQPSRVVRVSGGEPFLQQDGIRGVVAAFLGGRGLGMDQPYLWIDTNLTFLPTPRLLQDLGMNRDLLGVCGCFKPHRGQGTLDLQAEYARTMIQGNVDLYLYWPVTTDKEEVKLLAGGSHAPMTQGWQNEGYQLSAWVRDHVHPLAPLRLSFDEIHYEYAALDWDFGGYPPASWKQITYARTMAMRQGQWEFMRKHYRPELQWLPSHQVELR